MAILAHMPGLRHASWGFEALAANNKHCANPNQALACYSWPKTTEKEVTNHSRATNSRLGATNFELNYTCPTATNLHPHTHAPPSGARMHLRAHARHTIWC